MAVGLRRGVRIVTGALSLAVGVLYVVLLFQVANAETTAAAGETTYGAYLFLALPYLAGGVLVLTVDRRAVFAVGAAVQLVVLGLFVVFGIGLLGPGVFEDETLSALPMALWATVITAAEIGLLGLLAYLAARPARPDGRLAPG